MRRFAATWFSLLACGSLICGALAADPEGTYSDPAKTDADFAIQGEYAGEIDEDGQKAKIAVQIIALGGGKFHAVAYPGGFPGEGWDGEKKIEEDGETKDGATIFQGDEGSGIIRQPGSLIIRDKDGKETATLPKVTRKSTTEGKKPPEGAIVLFDGKKADAFESARMTEDGLLIPPATTKQKFGSGTLHIEFRTPYMPAARGQARGNSGCYLQGRYEVQVLDSFGLEGKDNECGGIYSIKSPDRNLCYPPLAWQTYDIEYTAAKFDAQGKKIKSGTMTVKHNGVEVHKQVELTQATTAAPVKEGPEPGPIYLQDHGNPVRYRNIWFLEKKD